MRYISKVYSNLWLSLTCFKLDNEVDKMYGVFYMEGEGKWCSFNLKKLNSASITLPFSFTNAAFLFLHAIASIEVENI